MYGNVCKNHKKLPKKILLPQACHCEDNMYKFRLALKLIAHDGSRMLILVATEDSNCSCCCSWPLQA